MTSLAASNDVISAPALADGNYEPVARRQLLLFLAYISENFITVLTPAVYDYQYLPEVAVSRKCHVALRVRAAAWAHVALSTVYGDTDHQTYEIVLGGWENKRSAIRYGGRGPVVAETATPELLDADDFRSFWISWEASTVEVGRGMKKGLDRFLTWSAPPGQRHAVNCMSVSTGDGASGQWEFVEYLGKINWLNAGESDAN